MLADGEVFFGFILLYMALAALSALFWEEDAPFKRTIPNWNRERKRRRAAKKQRKWEEKAERERLRRAQEAEAKKPTKEQLLDVVNEFYAKNMQIIENSMMDEDEKEAAREYEKRHHLKKISQIMEMP